MTTTKRGIKYLNILGLLAGVIIIAVLVLTGMIVSTPTAHALSITGSQSNGDASSGSAIIYFEPTWYRTAGGWIDSGGLTKYRFPPDYWDEVHRNAYKNYYNATNPQYGLAINPSWLVATQWNVQVSRGTDPYNCTPVAVWSHCDDSTGHGDGTPGGAGIWNWMAASPGGPHYKTGTFNYPFLLADDTDHRPPVGRWQPDLDPAVHYVISIPGKGTWTLDTEPKKRAFANDRNILPDPFINLSYAGIPTYGAANSASISADLTEFMLLDPYWIISQAEKDALKADPAATLTRQGSYVLTANLFDGYEQLLWQNWVADTVNITVKYKTTKTTTREERIKPIIPTRKAAIQGKTGGQESSDKWRSFLPNHTGSWVCDGRRMGLRTGASITGKSRQCKVTPYDYSIKLTHSTPAEGAPLSASGSSKGAATIYPSWYYETAKGKPDVVDGSCKFKIETWDVVVTWAQDWKWDGARWVPDGKEYKVKQRTENRSIKHEKKPTRAYLNIGLEVLTR